MVIRLPKNQFGSYYRMRVAEDETTIMELLNDDTLSINMEDMGTLISKLNNDDLKKEMLEKWKDRIAWGPLATVIESFQDDNVKIESISRFHDRLIYDHDLNYLSSVIRSIQDDNLKLEVLKTYSHQLSNNGLCWVIASLHEDKNKNEVLKDNRYYRRARYNGEIIASFAEDREKLTLLEKYQDKLEHSDFDTVLKSFTDDDCLREAIEKYHEHIRLTEMIATIKNDSIKKELLNQFHEFIYAYDMASIIESFQDDEMKRELITEYESRMNQINIASIMSSFHSDIPKQTFIEENKTKLDQKSLVRLINSLEDDVLKLKYIEEFLNKFSSDDLASMIRHLQDEKRKIEVLEKYRDKIQSSTLKELLEGFSDEYIKEAFEKCADRIDDKDMVGLIIEAYQDDEEKKQAIKKYQDRVFPYFMIADGIKSLKLDASKIEMLAWYVNDSKESYNMDKNIVSIISSMKEDEAKKQELEKYIASIKRIHLISSIIQSYRGDLYKLEGLEKYGDQFNDDTICDIINTLSEDESKIEALKKNISRIHAVLYYKNVLEGLKEDKSKLQFVEMGLEYFDSKTIVNFLWKFDSDEVKKEVIEKVIAKLNPTDFGEAITKINDGSIQKDIINNLMREYITTIQKDEDPTKTILEILNTMNHYTGGNKRDALWVWTALNCFDLIDEACMKELVSQSYYILENKDFVLSLNDQEKTMALNLFSAYLNLEDKANIIKNIEDMETRIGAMFISDAIGDYFNVVKVIKELQDVELKKKITCEYHEFLYHEALSKIIESMPEDKDKLEMLKKLFSELDRASIITKLKDDENKIKVLEEYSDKMDSREIATVVHSLAQEQDKMDMLAKYSHKMNGEDITSVICSLEDEKNKIDMLAEYSHKMKGENITSVIESLEDEKNILDMLGKCVEKLDGNDISQCICKLENDADRIETLKKYMEYDPDIVLVLKQISCTAQNYDLLNPEINVLLSKYPKVAGKGNLEELKKTLLSGLIRSMDFGPYYDDDEEEIFANCILLQLENVEKWLKIGFIPSGTIFKKIQDDKKISKFDKNMWFELQRCYLAQGLNNVEEPKMGLLEMAYCFGVFDKGSIESNGRFIETDERKENESDYQNRLGIIKELLESRKTR